MKDDQIIFKLDKKFDEIQKFIFNGYLFLSKLIKRICYIIFLIESKIIENLPHHLASIPKKIYNSCKEIYANFFGKEYNKEIFAFKLFGGIYQNANINGS